MRKLLLSHANPAQRQLLDLASPHYRAYAQRHGYETRLVMSPLAAGYRTPQWAKIALLRDALADADLCLWLDNDLVLRDQEHDIADGLDDADFQAFCLEQTPHGFGPNSGVWLMRSCPEAKAFLDDVWLTGPLPDATLNDQATIAHLLGFSYLPTFTKPIASSRYLAHTGWLDARWNMLSVFHPEAPLVARAVHYGGLDFAAKYEAMREQLIRDRLPGFETLLDPAVVAELTAPHYPHPCP